MLIGILECGDTNPAVLPRHGDYSARFRDLLSIDPGLTFRTWLIYDGEMPTSPAEADGWLVTGSRHGVYDPLDWIAPFCAFLRDIRATGRPIAGVCFGHQIIAQAFGGRAEKAAQGWGLGLTTYEVTADSPVTSALGDSFRTLAVHQDQVTALPPDGTVLAKTAHTPIAAALYGDPAAPDAISVQPHPEFDADYVSDLIDARLIEACPPEVIAAARIETPADNARWATTLARFFREAEARRAA